MECDGAPLSWLYGPLLTQKLPRAMDESRRLAGSNYEQGMGLVDRFGCKLVYVYAMGQEPWLGYISSIKPNLNSSETQLVGMAQEIEKICALWCNALDVR